MLKYRGQFRVLWETDTRTGQAAEFTFVPCRIRKGAVIYRFNDNILAVYIPGSRTANRLLQEHSDIFRAFQMGDIEIILFFSEKDIKKAAAILKARIQGKNKSPKPKRKRTLTEEQKNVLRERLAKARLNKSLLEKNSVSHTVNQF